MGTYEPFQILHRSYPGASFDQRNFIDSVIGEINNYYLEKYPSVGIDKSLLYKNVAGINFYDSKDIVIGGYFDRNTKQFNANEGISCYDEHKFHITVHELMHSTINLSKIFGAFIDEGFVDLQSNAITGDKSSYSDQRILTKILEIIFGEETLLRIALGKEIKQKFNIDSEMIKSFRIKSEVAQKLWVEQNEKYDILYEKLLYSMIDDLLEMYNSVSNNLPFLKDII